MTFGYVGEWHFADKPTAQGFVAYWGNNGHRLALPLNGSVANDPERPLYQAFASAGTM